TSRRFRGGAAKPLCPAVAACSDQLRGVNRMAGRRDEAIWHRRYRASAELMRLIREDTAMTLSKRARSGRASAGAPALAAVCILTGPALAEAGRSIAVVLDASGSMNTKLPDGQTRMEAAKAAVAELAGKLTDDTRLALRVYGHQSSPQQKNCKDSALVVG